MSSLETTDSNLLHNALSNEYRAHDPKPIDADDHHHHHQRKNDVSINANENTQNNDEKEEDMTQKQTILTIEHGHCSEQGIRPKMEDQVVVQSTLNVYGSKCTSGHLSIYGVFDGHGGSQCAEFCASHIINILSPYLLTEDSVANAFTLCISDLDTKVMESAQDASGSTCCIVLIDNKTYDLWCCNVGDSRCILINTKYTKVKQLSIEHKPDHPLEKQRIENANGWVTFGRVCGLLAVSRSLGDKDFKYEIENLVISTPDVTHHKLVLDEDQCIVLACGGLFDVFSNQQCMEWIASHNADEMMEAQQLARQLCHDAIHVRKSKDNVSVLVLKIDTIGEDLDINVHSPDDDERKINRVIQALDSNNINYNRYDSPHTAKADKKNVYNYNENFFSQFKSLGIGQNDDQRKEACHVFSNDFDGAMEYLLQLQLEQHDDGKQQSVEQKTDNDDDWEYDENMEEGDDDPPVFNHSDMEVEDHHFRTHKQSALQIQLNPMKQQLDKLLVGCYEIIDSEQPDPPQIDITNGVVGGLVIEILDKDKALNDKYEIVINDTIQKEFVNGDNKQQYIELVDDIEPLTLYHIVCRRYVVTKERWSKHCTPIDIVTDVKFSWSKAHRGNNAKLSNLSRDVYCKSHKGSCSIVADKDISSVKFKEVLFSFTMTSIGHLSYCGFVQYANSDAFEQNMRAFWDDLVVKNGGAYCLGFCDDSSAMQRWVNGSKKGKSKFKKDLKLQNGQKIHAGDMLLYHVDFDRMACDVYINEESEANKISSDIDQNTFVNIPDHIIPVYSHENNPYIIAHSNVTIKMERYVLR